MVGVAGGSKACSACRSRKIKCDESFPSCGQCQRSHRLCSGSIRTRIFIDERQRLQRRYGLPILAGKNVNVSRRTEGRVYHQSLPTTVISTATLYQPSKGPAFHSLYLDHFITSFKIRPFSHINTSCDPQASWLQYIPEFLHASSPSSPIVKLAIEALITAHYARITSNAQILAIAIEWYGEALKRHKDSLVMGNMCLRDEVLCAGMLLEFFEAVSCASANGWVALMEGFLRLMEMRGPRRHVDGFGGVMYRSQRWLGIVQSTVTRKATFLSHPDWQTIPWSNFSTKPHIQKALDLMTQLPALLESHDILFGSPNNPKYPLRIVPSTYTPSDPISQEMIALHEKFLTLDFQLEQWMVEYENMAAAEVVGERRLFWSEGKVDIDANPDYTGRKTNSDTYRPAEAWFRFKQRKYRDFAAASAILRWASTKILVLRHILRTTPTSSSSYNSRTIKLEQEIGRHCISVFSSIKYFYDAKSIGATHLIFPLKVAFETLRHSLEDEAEVKRVKVWVTGWLKRLDVELGMGVSCCEEYEVL